MLPKAISVSPCVVAKSENRSSGKMYRRETRSIPIATFVMLSLWVKATTESAVQSALFDKKKMLTGIMAVQMSRSINNLISEYYEGSL